jgi:hypothetical protein
MTTLYTIPIKDAASGPFYFTTELNGVNFQLALHFNPRDGGWYLDISDLAGNPLRSGIRIAVNIDVLRRWMAEGKPTGKLGVLDLRPTPTDPTLDGLGNDCQLVFNG